MRFERIDLIRYGMFTDWSVPLPARDPDYWLIYGDNEAGKSTMLRAIRGLLFGIEARTTDDFLHAHSTMRVGAVLSSDKGRLEFRRRKGNRATLLGPDEAPLPDDALAQFLVELDEPRFVTFYGLDHEMLRKGGEELAAGKGDVGKTLFEAAGLIGLRKLIAGLEARADALFTSQAKSRPINEALQAYKQARAESRQQAISGEEIERQQDDLAAVLQKLEALKAENEENRHALQRLQRIQGNKPDLAGLASLRNELASLHNVPDLDRDAAQRRERAAVALSGAHAQAERLAGRISQREEQLAELVSDPELKRHHQRISALNQQTSQYRTNLQHVAKRQSEAGNTLRQAHDQWRLLWPERSMDEADSLRPVETEKEAIRALITEHGRIEELQAALQRDIDDAQAQKADIEQQIDRAPDPPDASKLAAAIEAARRLGDVEAQRAKIQAEQSAALAAAGRELGKLRGWTRDLAAVESMAVPLAATIDRYVAEWEQIQGEHKELQRTRAANKKERREAEQELSKLRRKGELPTAEDLAEARRKRDTVWQAIRGFAFDQRLSLKQAAIEAGATGELPAVFQQNMERADQLADRRFEHAESAVLYDRLAETLGRLDIAEKEATDQGLQLDARTTAFEQRWAAEWAEWTPFPPKETLEWCRQRDVVIERLSQARSKGEEASLLSSQVTAQIDEVSARITEVRGAPAAPGESLAALLNRAGTLVQKLVAHQQSRVTLDENLRTCDRRIEQVQVRESQYEARKRAWDQEWRELVSRFPLGGDTSPARMNAVLSGLDKVFRYLDDHKSLQHRVDALQADIDAFREQVAQLVQSVDPAMRDVPPERAVEELHARLVAVREADAKRAEQTAEMVCDREELSDWEGKISAARDELDRLRRAARCETEQELDRVLADSQRKTALRDDITRIEKGLIDRNAGSLETVEQEASLHDIDQLAIEIARRQERVSEIARDLVETGSRRSDLERALRMVEAVDNSAVAAQRAEQALAIVREATEDYVRLRLSVEVLRMAMESYRQRNQGPVLKRAAEIFSKLTLGEHQGLVTDFDQKDQPVLVTIKKNGERLGIELLSDGARDQLYLALRLAAIELHVTEFGTMPVILDDALINSDDHRAEAALQHLATLAKQTQVLFFSHHRRLADLGIAAGAKLIEIPLAAGVGA
jgi:uncharacterized protein YhaN